MLKASGICKSFGDIPVIKDLTHEFAENSYTVIMGSSGCGKTTLLHILMGIIKPDKGELTGFDRKKSAVFQEDRLCENLTVLSNLRLVLPGKPDNAALTAGLERVGLAEHALRPVRELSGGMKRRLALVRALTVNYDILFLDEPFKGLDSETKLSVMDCCRERTAGRTVIMVTHDKEEAEYFGGHLLLL